VVECALSMLFREACRVSWRLAVGGWPIRCRNKGCRYTCEGNK
jgi:hypothetical protein